LKTVRNKFLTLTYR